MQKLVSSVHPAVFLVVACAVVGSQVLDVMNRGGRFMTTPANIVMQRTDYHMHAVLGHFASPSLEAAFTAQLFRMFQLSTCLALLGRASPRDAR